MPLGMAKNGSKNADGEGVAEAPIPVKGRARSRAAIRGGEYQMDEVCSRIEERRLELGMTVRTLCDATGMRHYDYSRKVRQDHSTFTVAEVSAIAWAMGARIGWPWLSDATLDRIEVWHGPLPLVRPVSVQ